MYAIFFSQIYHAIFYFLCIFLIYKIYCHINYINVWIKWFLTLGCSRVRCVAALIGKNVPSLKDASLDVLKWVIRTWKQMKAQIALCKIPKPLKKTRCFLFLFFNFKHFNFKCTYFTAVFAAGWLMRMLLEQLYPWYQPLWVHVNC